MFDDDNDGGVQEFQTKEIPGLHPLLAALVKAKKEFEPAIKGNVNPHFKSKYADLSACLDAVNDALLNNGIALIQASHPCDDGVIIETIFAHESGAMLPCGKVHVPASKHDAQAFGSAMTYARRYSLMAACLSSSINAWLILNSSSHVALDRSPTLDDRLTDAPGT